jgi:NADH-quinone oxidoreductase subunit C
VSASENSIIELYVKIQKATGIEFDEIDEDLPVLYVQDSQLVRALTILNNNKDLLYRRLIDIVVVDRPENEKRFEINYIIMSMLYNHRLNVRIAIEEEDKISRIEHIYQSAYYRECEISEMFGINFYNDAKLQKFITCGKQHEYPLRKNTQLPMEKL